MHNRTYEIIKNLGYDEKVLEKTKRKSGFNRKTLAQLKKLGLPELALKQIKFFENYPTKKLSNKTNKELIQSLIKKCKRSLDAFANKNIEAKIVFEDNDWTFYSSVYNKAISKLYVICKPYFDEWSEFDIEVTFLFDGSSSWKVITTKESDLPGN